MASTCKGKAGSKKRCLDPSALDKRCVQPECKGIESFLLAYQDNDAELNTCFQEGGVKMGFADICFATAWYVYTTIARKNAREIHLTLDKKPDQIFPYLRDEDVVIYMELDSNSQGHGVAIIPLGSGWLYTIQSLGGLFAPFGTVWKADKFIRQLRCLDRLKSVPDLLCFKDKHATYVDFEFKIKKRKKRIGPHLIKDVTPFAQQLVAEYEDWRAYDVPTSLPPELDLFRDIDAYRTHRRNYDRWKLALASKK